MREKERRHKTKKLDPTTRRSRGHWLSTVHWRNQLDPVTYFHIDDRYTGTRHYYITDKEFANSITITFVSLGSFGIGLGQIIVEIFGK